MELGKSIRKPVYVIIRDSVRDKIRDSVRRSVSNEVWFPVYRTILNSSTRFKASVQNLKHIN